MQMWCFDKYAEIGLKVFPVYEIDNGSCACKKGESCGSPGKHPRNWKGLKYATDDLKQIGKWLKKWPDANIGIRTGTASGIFVLDVDDEAGQESLWDLLDQYGTLPDTWQVLTGKGRHLYLKHPGYRRIPCSTSKVAPKLDIRGDGGYVVAPPSLHVSGRRYEWEPGFSPDDIPLADAPEWLIKLAWTRKPSTGVQGIERPLKPGCPCAAPKQGE